MFTFSHRIHVAHFWQWFINQKTCTFPFSILHLWLLSFQSIDKPALSPTIAAQLTANNERTAKEYEELRRRIAVEAMCLSQRVPRVRQQVMHEQERINRLAEVYQVKCCNVVYCILFVSTDSYKAQTCLKRL